jgi:hypothetical protein
LVLKRLTLFPATGRLRVCRYGLCGGFQGCGLNVTGKKIEFDHIIPEAMLLPADKLKPITIEEGQLLGRDCCHRGPDGKTARDVEAIARAKRMEAAHHGLEAPSRLRGAGFKKAGPQRRASAPLTKSVNCFRD